ncbi:MAG: extracellular solute-binding protein [Dehalococcoidia bacterium]
MYSGWKKYRRHLTRRRSLVGLLSVLAVIMLVAAACGEEATPTPIPATSTPVIPATPTSGPPLPTATPVSGATATPRPPATATSVPTDGLRPLSEWTADNPATLAEIEAELEKYRGDSFVFTSWGGAYQAAQRQAYLIPFQDQFGIQIIEESPVEYAKIRAMSEAGNVTWDVVVSGNRALWQLGPEGTLEELTPAIHNGYWDGFPDITRTPWGAGGGDMWSTGIAYSLESYPNHQGAPKSWADFWDVEGFPGRRGLLARPNEDIFFAYLAAHPELFDTAEGRASLPSLTDAQLDEAFDMLRQIKPDITRWWTSGSECPQLLLSGELDMCAAWNGRIYDAQQAGAPIYYCFECGHLMQMESYYIPKGSPNKELAELFIAWMGFPEQAMRIALFITYGPLNQDALPFLEAVASPELLAAMSTSYPESAIVVDENWLGTNVDALTERMQAFLAE